MSNRLEALFERRTFGIRLGLQALRDAHDALGRPACDRPSVVVVGTNGKGSVAAMCAHALAGRGHRVGLYTSPHLLRVNERIRIDGRPVDDEALEQAVDTVLEAEKPGAARPLSFFEVLTLAALVVFETRAVDTLVLEAGLGGRLDAVRLAHPVAVGVATIDRDHQAFLGASLTAIAREKAGVFVGGAPVLTGPQHPEAMAVLRQVAASIGAPLLEVGPLDRSPSALPGDHQRVNAAVALHLARTLEPEACPADLEGVQWPARLQSLRLGPGEIVLDAAHNLGGIEALVQHLRTRAPLQVVFGAQADKPSQAMAMRLRELGPLWWVHLEEGADPPEPASRAFSGPEVPELHQRIEAAAAAGETVLVCGSHRLVGPVAARLHTGATWRVDPSEPPRPG